MFASITYPNARNILALLIMKNENSMHISPNVILFEKLKCFMNILIKNILKSYIIDHYNHCLI